MCVVDVYSTICGERDDYEIGGCEHSGPERTVE